MKKITLLFLFLAMTAFGQNTMCDYTLEMNDDFGDGWNGAIMDVLVDGIVVLDDVTLGDDPNNDGDQGILAFSVSVGADVTTFFVDEGGFPDEISYRILDANSIEVATGDVENNIETGTITAICPSCIAPSLLTVGNITNVSADLSWTDSNNPIAGSYDVEWGETGFTLGTGTVEAGVANLFTLGGLTSNTSYDFYVTTNCSEDESSIVSGSMTFTTALEIAPPGECEYTLQMFDGFGDGWNGALLNVFRNGQVVLLGVSLDDDPANDGDTGSLTFEILPGDDITTVLVDGGVFPDEITYNILAVDGITIVGSGDANNNIVSGTVTGSCEMICTAPSNLLASNITDVSADLSWTDLNDPITGSYDIEWGEAGFTLGTGTLEAGLGDVMFALEGLEPNTSYEFYAAVNCEVDGSSVFTGPFMFITTVSCFQPTDLVASNITDVSADLSWTDENAPVTMSYDLEWGVQGFVPGQGTLETGLTDPMFALEGLDTDTSYDFYVVANCDVDNSSLVSGPVTFATTPEMAPPGECEYRLEMFDSFGDGWNGGLLNVFRNGQIVLFEVSLDDDPANDGSIGSLAFEVLPGDDVTTVLVDDGLFPGEISYTIIAVDGITAVAFGDGEDDIISGTVTASCEMICSAPSSLLAENITDVSADLSWSDFNSPAAGSYDVEWGETGFVLGTGTVEAGVTNPFILVGLTPNTSYDYYVTTNCSEDESSEVSGLLTFSTLPEMAPPGECEYTLQMFDDFGDGWNGALLNVFRNGQVVLSEVSLGDDPENDGSIGLLTFEILPGDDITTVLVDAGGFPEEISYNILAVDGTTVIASGDALNDIVSGTLSASCVLSVEDNNALEGFTFFPNPALDVLTLDARTGIENVTIFNLLGQIVLEQRVDGLSTYQLNVSAMAKGAYIMEVTSNGSTGTYRVLKN